MPEAISTAFTPASDEEPPGLYLHIPFCKSRCAYCSFNSYVCQSPPGAYLEALAVQIRYWGAQQWCRERTFSSFFIGGGTPTIYGEELAALVALCLKSFNFTEDPEITVEGNPNTVTVPMLASLRRAGVNRLSLGVQAFSDRLLGALGRSHTKGEAHAAIKGARRAGFANINLDLMYGLPGQSATEWRESLDQALACGPEHLACYELTIEEETPFAGLVERGELILPEEEEVLAMAELSHDLLVQAGLPRYEISNYAAPGNHCRHNLNYWRNGSYLGLGAGAVSCLSGFRFSTVREPEPFAGLVQKGEPPLAEGECLPLAARFRESVVMGLRMTEGISVARLQRRFGLTPPGYYGKMLEELQQQGLVVLAADSLRLTEAGLPVANQVLARLV
ncbi:MAG: radical SAM family heme chaperone HemW [Desulfurivibrionaceae bacterium]|nr:radical SAM family heme chaperone HemW [Desulfurivibrionaceae bacterium]